MSLRILAQLCLVVVLACNVAACGNKGKLKSPTQIQVSEAKKAKKKARQAKEPRVAAGYEHACARLVVLVVEGHAAGPIGAGFLCAP